MREISKIINVRQKYQILQIYSGVSDQAQIHSLKMVGTVDIHFEMYIILTLSGRVMDMSAGSCCLQMGYGYISQGFLVFQITDRYQLFCQTLCLWLIVVM